MSEPPLLRLQDAALVVGGYRALDRIDLSIAPGERVAIVGESGTGKSLVARLAAALSLPTEGEVWLGGTAVSGCVPDRLRALRAGCGISLQGGGLIRELGVADNLRLAFGVGARGAAARHDRRITRALLDFRLEGLATAPVHALSVGEQRRTELARAFVRDPALVILDEPFEGARADAAWLTGQLDRQVRGRGRALLLLTQDPELAARLAERVYGIERGRLVEQPAGTG